jgi:hypothetical protein
MTPAPILIAALRCPCGSTAPVAAIWPGDEPETVELLGLRIVTSAGRAVRGRCWACLVGEPAGAG